MVVAWHYFGGGNISGHGVSYHLFVPGRSGVDLFFVLSGFLITSILIEKRGAPNYYSAFYVRRALRILPIYVVMVALLVAGRSQGWVPSLFGGEFPVWSYFFFLQNFAMAGTDSYGPWFMSATWSLAIEEQYYLAFPFVVAFVSKRALPKVLIAILVIAPLLRIWSYSHTGSYMPSYVLTSHRADTLAIGALIAWAFSEETVKAYVFKNVRLVRWALLALIVVAPLLWAGRGETFPMRMAYWGHTYLTLLYGSIVLFVLTHTNARELWPLRSRLAFGVATISYTLYLVHQPVQGLIEAIGGQDFGAGWAVIAFCVSVSVSALSYFAIERPCLRLGRRFTYETQPIRDAAEKRDELERGHSGIGRREFH